MHFRFFHYFMLLGMFMSTMVYVPSVLFQQRYDGAMMSIVLSILIGAAIYWLFVATMKKFPGQGLPEIMAGRVGRLVYGPLLFIWSLVWAFSGMQVLVGYSIVINRFIAPDIPYSFILLFTAFIVWFGATRSSRTVLNVVEITMVLNLPFVLLIFAKALSGENFNWDAVRAIANHLVSPPNYEGIAVSTFVYIGVFMLSIMNRLADAEHSLRWTWVVPLIAAVSLMTSFFVPLGYHGTEAVASYVYPWSSTSDALSMEFGFIERVLFIFTTVYIHLTLLYSMVVWHIAAELLKGCFPRKKPNLDAIETPWFTKIVCAVYVIGTLVYSAFIQENEHYNVRVQWHHIRFVFEIAVTLLLFALSRRRKRV